MVMTQQLYLFVFVLVFFFIVFVVRSWLLWKNTGINPTTFGRSDDAHGFNGKLMKIISVFEIGMIALYAFKTDWYTYLLPFWYLEHSILNMIGWGLLHISLLWIFIAQLQMANSWRIGIDYENNTELVKNGLFSISRNPIFFGILIEDLGLFLVIPNALSLLIICLSWYAIQVQVRLEEAHLKQTQGTDYEQYSKRVRRWI